MPTRTVVAETDMRLVLDILVAVMLIAMLAGAVYFGHFNDPSGSAQETCRSELRRFQRQVTLQAALQRGDGGDLAHPGTIDPDWFSGGLPTNPLLGPAHPWVEVIDEGQRNLEHPVDPAITDPAVARFWYNPYRGIVRARVPASMSDTAAVDLYNFVNDAELVSLFMASE